MREKVTRRLQMPQSEMKKRLATIPISAVILMHIRFQKKYKRHVIA